MEFSSGITNAEPLSTTPGKSSPKLLHVAMALLAMSALSSCNKNDDPRRANHDPSMLSASGARPVYDNSHQHVLDKEGKITWEFPQYNSDGTIKKDSGGNIIYGPTPPASIKVEKNKNTNTPTEGDKREKQNKVINLGDTRIF